VTSRPDNSSTLPPLPAASSSGTAGTGGARYADGGAPDSFLAAKAAAKRLVVVMGWRPSAAPAIVMGGSRLSAATARAPPVCSSPIPASPAAAAPLSGRESAWWRGAAGFNASHCPQPAAARAEPGTSLDGAGAPAAGSCASPSGSPHPSTSDGPWSGRAGANRGGIGAFGRGPDAPAHGLSRPPDMMTNLYGSKPDKCKIAPGRACPSLFDRVLS
jgi:hypothetical protein